MLTTQDRALGGLGQASLPWWCWENHLLAVATCFVHPGTQRSRHAPSQEDGPLCNFMPPWSTRADVEGIA